MLVPQRNRAFMCSCPESAPPFPEYLHALACAKQDLSLRADSPYVTAGKT